MECVKILLRVQCGGSMFHTVYYLCGSGLLGFELFLPELKRSEIHTRSITLHCVVSTTLPSVSLPHDFFMIAELLVL